MPGYRGIKRTVRNWREWPWFSVSPAQLDFIRFWSDYGKSVFKQIRKKHIIAGLLDLPQPGKEEKLLLELPEGGRVARGGLYYRTACACLWELYIFYRK